MKPLGTLIKIAASAWDNKVAGGEHPRSRHLAAWKKADSVRWGKFLRCVDGLYSRESVEKMIASFESTTFTDPFEIMADRQRLDAVNCFALQGNNVHEVLTPYSSGLLVANQAAGAVIAFEKELRGNSYIKGVDLKKNILDMMHEPADKIYHAGPGLYLDSDNGEARVVDNAWLVENGHITEEQTRKERIISYLVKAKGSDKTVDLAKFKEYLAEDISGVFGIFIEFADRIAERFEKLKPQEFSAFVDDTVLVYCKPKQYLGIRNRKTGEIE